MLDFNDLGDKIEPSLFFCGDSLHLNWSHWTIENMTGSTLPASAQHFMKQAALEAHNRICNITSSQFLTQYGYYFEFYTYNKILEEALLLHREGHTLEAACLLFPFFEHTIGDMICCVKGCIGVESGVKWGDNQDPCPSRITEILEHQDTEILLGKDLVYVLKLLIGPMTGFNLRNLTWHGFIYPSEFPPCLLSLIFVICVSLPNVVVQNWKKFKYSHAYGSVPSKSRNWFHLDAFHESVITGPILDINLAPNTLPYFPAVASQLRRHYRTRSDLYKTFTKFRCSFPAFDLSGVEHSAWEDLKALIRQSGFPLVGQMDQWNRCVDYYQAQKYFEFVVISIPMIEHSLRRAFACENKSADRLISADPTSLMTIMDIILSYKLEQGITNELIPVLGDKVLSLLWDLFVWSDGCLLRDYLAHGTVPPNEIPIQYTHQVFAVMIFLMAKFNSADNWAQNTIVQECVRYNCDFVPNFNPKNVLLYTMKNVYTSLGTFTQINEVLKKFEWPKGKPKDEGGAGEADQREASTSTAHTSPAPSAPDPTSLSNGISPPLQPPQILSPQQPEPPAQAIPHTQPGIAAPLSELTLNNAPEAPTDDNSLRCYARASFYLDNLLHRMLDRNNNSLPSSSVIPNVSELLFNSTATISPVSPAKLSEFQPEFALWCPKCIQQFVENLISTCSMSTQFINAVTEEHTKLYDLVITRRAWKAQREMFTRLKKVFHVFPLVLHLVMVIVESSFHLADSLQKTVMIAPTDDIPQLEPIAVFIRKLNDCIAMMTTAVRSHWWANAVDLFECFIGRKFDTSFSAVDPQLYTPFNASEPTANVIEFQNMNKRDKKSLENSIQDYYVEFSHAAPTPPAPPPPTSFECEVCRAAFTTGKLLRKHVKDMDHRKWKLDIANKTNATYVEHAQ